MNFADKKICAKIERIAYPKDLDAFEDGVKQFYILKCDVGTVKGSLAHKPVIGESIVVEGKWEVSSFNGQPEFSFFHSQVYIPRDERSLLKYACEMTKGFGPQMEERIWDARHDDWRNVEYADGVRGLTPRLLSAFQDTIQFITTHEAETNAVSYLMSLGLTTRMAESAFEKWGVSTIERVNANCYILAELPNYGFSDVDKHIRNHFCIERNDKRRVMSCLDYYVRQLTQEDTVVTWDELYNKVSKAIDSDPSVISDCCREMFTNGQLMAFPKTMRIARMRDFVAEANIYKYVSGAVETKGQKAKQPPERSFDLDSVQMDAVQYAIDHSFSIINGGAGCGKTTLVKAIIHSLGSNVEVCAFAGKAAARLKEATGYPAGTIHKMLGYMGDQMGFTRRSLAGVTVIVDEASMVASDLMNEIVKREPKRLILVGDEAQLPPVGSGQPFHDLIRICPESVKTLTTCYRNKEAIFSSALQIRNGLLPMPNAKSENELWNCTSIRDIRAAHYNVLELVKRGEVNFDTDIILCCRNGEKNEDNECSVLGFNQDIKEIVNQNADGSFKISAGDRVINTKNDAANDVWNGTTGRCRCFDTDGAMWVDLDYPRSDGTKEALIEKGNVKHWQLAYALTVHKSQGSQYRKVFFVVARRDAANLLTRPMVYTAVTRAKRECHVVGDMSALHAAINKVCHKSTVIQEFASK